LQEVHRQHPAAVIWDDHDFADNAYRSGANNHQPSVEGSWDARKQAAMRAYYEWMPLRAVDPGDLTRIYRSFAFGDLVDLLLLDTRIIGRDRQIDDACDPAQINDPEHSLLGSTQESWLTGELAASKRRGTRWRLLGQQVAFAQFLADPPMVGCIGSRDKWSAHAATRTRVLDAIESGGIDNVVILSGDSHSSWGLDVARDPFDPAVYDPETGRGSLAVELIGPGVTSPAIADPEEAAASELRYKATHPHLRFAEHHHQGYFLVDITPERARAEWYFVSPVREPGATERLGGAVVTLSGQNHLVPA
jgi:alkaline phosphatase D